jgi:peptide deformylase
MSGSVLLIGDPKLRVVSKEVPDAIESAFLEDSKRLKTVLDAFRKENGFGRGISAPQIGIQKRFIALNLGDERGTFVIINPKITSTSTNKFTMWDDCMSFPWLMVKVQRHSTIDIEYIDEKGVKQQWKNIDQAISELLQHEIDHLDGVLAVDRALDKEAIIARELYEKNRELYDKQVDYFIVPTIGK